MTRRRFLRGFGASIAALGAPAVLTAAPTAEEALRILTARSQARFAAYSHMLFGDIPIIESRYVPPGHLYVLRSDREWQEIWVAPTPR